MAGDQLADLAPFESLDTELTAGSLEASRGELANHITTREQAMVYEHHKLG